jgi:peptidoglycan/xylan/chitin deacetylase (PgdA/CDA1 family)
VPADRPLAIEFDMAMDRASVEVALHISPTLAGEFLWPSDRRVLFMPAGAWDATTGGYEVTLAAGTHSAEGGTLAEPFRLRYGAGGRGAPIPVLMYHRIQDLDASATSLQRTWTVSPDAFAAQMRYLAEHGWHSVSPAQVAAYLGHGEPLPARPVVISMDDGYREVYTTAYPILAETGLLPVLFVVPQYMGYGAYLDWPMLEELAAAGFAVGAHGYDHSDLRKAPDSDLPRQIVQSRAVLEERLGITVDSFCYPYGSYDRRTLDALAAAGYTTAFTLNPSAYQPYGDPYRLNRLLVTYETALSEFADLLPQ